jgi:hypothetical protein
MIYEVAQALIQRVLRDKILLGIVVVLVIAFFMNLGSNDDSTKGTKEKPPAETKAGAPLSDAATVANSDPNAPADGQPVKPQLATDFLKWWLTGAFDYTPATAIQSHQIAFGWMLPETQAAFQAAFWTPQIAQGVKDGTIVAAFHPSTVEATAVNPDGTVVVGVSGTLVIQSTGQPVTQQIVTDFLITKNQDGLRVAGVYNRSAAQPPAAPVSYVPGNMAPAGSVPVGYVQGPSHGRDITPMIDR